MDYLLLFCSEIQFLMVTLLMWQCLLLTAPMRLLMSVTMINRSPAACAESGAPPQAGAYISLAALAHL